MSGFVSFALIISLSTVLVGGVSFVVSNGQATHDSQRRRYEIHFPRDLEFGSVLAFVRSISGIHHKRQGLRPLPTMAFEVIADAQGIHHYLSIPPYIADFVVAQLRSQVPGARLTPDSSGTQTKWDSAVELNLKGMDYPLRIGSPEAVIATLLGSLHPLTADQSILLQWVVFPGKSQVPSPNDKQHIAKHSDHTFAAVGRIAANGVEAERLVRRVFLALSSLRTASTAFQYRRLPQGILQKRIISQRSTFEYPVLLNATELATLVAFPAGNPQVPGLPQGRSRHLPADPAITQDGFVIGMSNFPGAERPLSITAQDLTKHLHLVGPTGTGKSTLIENLAAQIIRGGYGLAAIDPKGDLAANLIDTIPYERLKDVIVLDPTDAVFPIGFNVLDGDPYLVTDQMMAIFDNLYGIQKMPRTADIFRSTVLTLAHQKMTLLDIPAVLASTAEGSQLRRHLTSQIKEVPLRAFWTWFDSIKVSEQIDVTAPLLRRLRPFELRPSLRACLGQTQSGFDLNDVLSQNKILIVSLAKGQLGEETSALFGSLIVTKLWQAAQSRSAIPAKDRTPFFLMIDEFQDYLNLPMSVADVLAQARSYGFSLTLAHQHLSQLPSSLRDSVLANARSKVVFQTTSGDASALAREFSPYLQANDLQALGQHEIVTQLVANDRVAPPATAVTLPPPWRTGSTKAVRAASHALYGRPMSEVERELAERHNVASRPPSDAQNIGWESVS